MLVDTSVWVDHFKHGNSSLVSLLAADCVSIHPLIIGDACGTPPNRQDTLGHIGNFNQVKQATIGEAMAFIERERLYGLGCGLIDILLLTSTLLTTGATLWTLDKRLAALAERLGVLYQTSAH